MNSFARPYASRNHSIFTFGQDLENQQQIFNHFFLQKDWKFAEELESVLNISNDLVVLAQIETKLNSAFGPVIRNETYNQLTAKTLMVIDAGNWGGYDTSCT